MKKLFIFLFSVAFFFSCDRQRPTTTSSAIEENKFNQKIDGYKGIWFELNQKYDYGDKYSGGLGTYTAKHVPLAIYAPEVDKTFFVYGGTTRQNEKHLLAMIGYYDHKKEMVSKPTVVYDKLDVNDPHDNPSLMIDKEGYLRVFVSGRAQKRKGIKLKSKKPFQIDEFELLSEEEFTYPQIWNTKQGFFHFFTKYTGTRELYFETSEDGRTWTSDQKLSGIKEKPEEKSGHYQLSNHFKDGEIIGTFFNRHRNGHPDTRTDLYYLQTRDFGKTWESVSGEKMTLPLTEVENKSRVINYLSLGKNVYMKDMQYDEDGYPIILCITSGGHEPGPTNEPYVWRVIRWDGKQWQNHIVTASDHNYDMGSLFLEGDIWKVVGPTEKGPQDFATGGEVAIWESEDKGQKWTKKIDVTSKSELNHFYVRRPLNAKAPFSYFWASGHAHELSISELYFGNFDGEVWKLPYDMKRDLEPPIKVTFTSNNE